MQEYITISIFDIFKPGPGPSSSHTIGPMNAASDFLSVLQNFLSNTKTKSLKLDVYLYGSLSYTGKGHGTHRAVLGGLLGWQPESCDCDKLSELLEDPEKIYEISVANSVIHIKSENIHFAGEDASLPFQNTLIFRLTENNKTLLEEEYYSIGGGFIQRKGESKPEPVEVLHKYRNMNEFRKIMRKSDLSLTEIILQNEEAISGKNRDEIFEGIDEIIDTMCQAVENGLNSDGILPGQIGLMRKASILFKNSKRCKAESERALARLNAFAMAAAEENAAGRRVVTAPTSGSAGVMPGIIFMMKNYLKLPCEKLREGIMAAALVGSVAKHNASIAGAEVGCQGEIGVASSMAAAMVAYAKGCSIKRVENAAEIALEHHLGMTCDPVDGYVQVPCIERNAIGAVTAFNAYVLASVGDPARQKITYDEVVEAMLETGKDMCTKYKETAKGGLAVCAVCC